MFRNLLIALTNAYWKFRARIQFIIRGVEWPKQLTIRGKLGLSCAGSIVIGENLTLLNDTKYNRAGICHPTQLVAAKGASLTIGNNVGISGASIYCAESISIGNHVLIGVNCHIYDTDFHPIDYLDRRESRSGKTSPVMIEEDVWLCASVTVLKGVTIGARSVIAAGSVVTQNIPPDTIAGGVPARPINTISPKHGPRSSQP